MYLEMGSESMRKARLTTLALEIGDYDDFVKKYGPIFSAEPSQVWEDIDRTGWFSLGLVFLCIENSLTLDWLMISLAMGL